MMVNKFNAGHLEFKFKELNGIVSLLANNRLKERNFNEKSELLMLNQLYSLILNIESFTFIDKDFMRNEFDDLLLSSRNIYTELSDLFSEDDSNTSWLYSKFDDFQDSYKSAYETLKSVL
ncbi:hypothetical protein [Macrococcoides canis]|uniref:hypothetical protein n=1 Tax=Macrococcoides canis TaxID=1855823 RepID=UPI0022B8882B|nr:hypothetical protein [Macrococcus canis]WBF53772.1 hypothetical protein LL975_05640 [Macrococcus canis]